MTGKGKMTVRAIVEEMEAVTESVSGKREMRKSAIPERGEVTGSRMEVSWGRKNEKE